MFIFGHKFQVLNEGGEGTQKGWDVTEVGVESQAMVYAPNLCVTLSKLLDPSEPSFRPC